MARPIKETPILFGEDARRFEARMQEKRRISQEERARINVQLRGRYGHAGTWIEKKTCNVTVFAKNFFCQRKLSNN